uniref:ATP synthase F0 subunit 8 n=1 Tax=Cricula andrei TaxID=2967087 RepID=UPI002A8334A0|nr:ATP synthase F0 subunit 8 [Cricula andrei]WOW98274.1 ATP synthase F0 subunit 8 [Cricula andrei]
MPQMMPINWMFLFIYFIIIFFTFNIMNYYIFNFQPLNKFNKKLNKKNNYNFLWKW